jgi:hypothetical protein
MTATETATPARLALNTKPFAIALKNALICAGKDQLRPILRAVLIEFEPTFVRFVGTDSYRMLVQTLPCEDGLEGTFLLERDDADRIAKMLPKLGSVVAVGLNDDGTSLEVCGFGTRYEANVVPGEFPSWQNLTDWNEVPKVGAPSTCAAFNPSFLADIGKIKPLDGNANGSHVRIGADPLKMAKFEVSTTVGRIVGGLMPVRT